MRQVLEQDRSPPAERRGETRHCHLRQQLLRCPAHNEGNGRLHEGGHMQSGSRPRGSGRVPAIPQRAVDTRGSYQTLGSMCYEFQVHVPSTFKSHEEMQRQSPKVQ